MLDYRPDAPSVELFTADEHCVLHDWFGVDGLRSAPDVDVVQCLRVSA